MISARLTLSLVRPKPACRLLTFPRSAAFTLSTVLTVAGIFFILCGLARPACAVQKEWSRRWDGPAHAADAAAKVAVDKNGNVFVAGYSSEQEISGSLAPDYRLVKYAVDGTELWNRHYDGPVQGEDDLSGLALDADGNAYITGASQGAFGFDYATLKYDPNGNRLWVRRYDGPAHGDDRVAAIVVDAAGSAYVTGYSIGLYGDADYLTLKYDTSGHTVWTSRYDGLPAFYGGYPRHLIKFHYPDYAKAIAVDADGNVYVTGTSDNESLLTDPDGFGFFSGYDCVTVKYSPTGSQSFAKIFTHDNDDSGNAISLGPDGSIYVAGYSYASIFDEFDLSYYYLTLKYDKDGNEQWNQLFQNTSYAHTYASALAVGVSGNVVVTGNNGTIKYGPNGTQEWYQPGFGTAVAVDAGGNVFVAGAGTGSSGDSNFALMKYGADGTPHWGRFAGPTPGTDYVAALALDGLGSVYIAGASNGDMRTIKYSQQ